MNLEEEVKIHQTSETSQKRDHHLLLLLPLWFGDVVSETWIWCWPHEYGLQWLVDPLLAISGLPNHNTRTTPMIPAKGAAARKSQPLPPSLAELLRVGTTCGTSCNQHGSSQASSASASSVIRRTVLACILLLDFMHLHPIVHVLLPLFIIFVICRKFIATKGARIPCTQPWQDTWRVIDVKARKLVYFNANRQNILADCTGQTIMLLMFITESHEADYSWRIQMQEVLLSLGHLSQPDGQAVVQSQLWTDGN